MDLRLKTLELQWYCQHQYLKWEFQPGLIGICGPNGAGKSNAINAVYAALTSDFSRYVGGRQACISQQRPAGVQSFVRLQAAAGSTEFEVTRWLHLERQLLKIGDRTWTKTAEIQNELEGALGLSRRILDEYVFIAQGDMCSFILARAADRARSFSRFCGTDVAEKCWEMLGDVLTRDRPAGLLTVDTTECEQKLARAKERCIELQHDLTEAKKALPSQEEADLLDMRIAQSLCYETVAVSLVDATAQATAQKQRLEELKEELAAAEEALVRAREEYEQRQKSARSAATDLALLDVRIKEARRRVALERELAGLQAQVGPAEVSAEEVAAAQQALAEAEAACVLQRTLAELDDQHPRCPTCGESGPALLRKIRAARAELASVEAKAAKLRDTLHHLQAAKQQFDRWQYEEEHRQQQVARIRQELKQLSGAKFTASDAEARRQCQEAVEAAEAAQRRLEEAEQRRQHVQLALAKQEEGLRLQEEKVAALTRQLSSPLVVRRSEIDAWKRQQAEWRAQERRVAGITAALAEAERTMREVAAELHRLQKAQERTRRWQAWLDLNEAVRSLFHRDALPAMVHRARLEEMEVSINRDLEEFDAPFRVEVASEELNLVARFRNGTVVPAQALSGGQKMMLSLAYRLATNTGLMFLDEPTDGLDRANRDLAADIFTRLGQLAAPRGYQIVMVTHDDAFSRCFNQMLELPGA